MKYEVWWVDGWLDNEDEPVGQARKLAEVRNDDLATARRTARCCQRKLIVDGQYDGEVVVLDDTGHMVYRVPAMLVN